jgi:hypothetical protein
MTIGSVEDEMFGGITRNVGKDRNVITNISRVKYASWMALHMNQCDLNLFASSTIKQNTTELEL